MWAIMGKTTLLKEQSRSCQVYGVCISKVHKQNMHNICTLKHAGHHLHDQNTHLNSHHVLGVHFIIVELVKSH